MPILNFTGGIILGVFVCGISISLLQFASSKIWELPVGFDPNNATPHEWGVVVNQMPLEAKLFLLFSYLIGSFLGGCVATIFSDGTRPVPRESLLVGSFFTFSNVANLYAIPHPLWMSIASMSIFIPAAVAGGTIFRSIFGQKPKENEFIQHQQQHQKNQQHLIKKKK